MIETNLRGHFLLIREYGERNRSARHATRLCFRYVDEGSDAYGDALQDIERKPFVAKEP